MKATRFAAAVVTGVMGMVMTILAGPSVAAADDHDGVLSCPTGGYQQDYDPVLTLATRPTHLKGIGYFGPCVSLTRPDLHDADFHLNAVGNLNCLLGGNSEGIMRFDWGGSGPDTVVEYPLISLTVRPDGQTIAIVTGTVTSGPFKDGLMVFESNLLTLGVEQCLTTGVESAAGPATVQFID